MRIVVVGATGYIGGRLVPRLLQKGYEVRAVSRTLAKMGDRYWAESAELVEANMLSYDSVVRALEGCDVAYYLVHSMVREVKDFAAADKKAAHNFVRAAKTAHLKRIIYLGGLGADNLSRHLRSRHEVAEIFAKSSIPTTTLRAAMIIGSGSASFEILRYLVDRLPYMITPRWVQSRVQPISVLNVMHYLVEVLESDLDGEYDIGGRDVLTYEELMHLYADVMHLKKRKLLRLSLLTPWLSSHWIGLITPLPAKIGRPLAEGLSSEVICLDHRIEREIPQELLSAREAIVRACENQAGGGVESSWIDAGTIPSAAWVEEGDPKWAGGTLFREQVSRIVDLPCETVWENILKVGGSNGWYSPHWLWKLRGFIDKLVGGVGIRRGRRNVDQLRVGDAVDFWRVHRLEENALLQLLAEMKLPGKAMLEFRLDGEEGRTQIMITASFLPHGLRGILYWYALFPFHVWIFKSMLNRLLAASSRNDVASKSSS
ncbi:MAG: hypothetical protein S4CHLAM81_04800 [Chlamydiales bacterium]|nr:hypothetical protein [Chlamydiales bacterium]MCH9635269.1 hypothetical protein [Chlamydiales bacterium]MCH9704100.1 SDR family oxidoreductase [Chlamydiota bacterium]